jgi:O-acetyl-ADP-ribose deacetylase
MSEEIEYCNNFKEFVREMIDPTKLEEFEEKSNKLFENIQENIPQCITIASSLVELIEMLTKNYEINNEEFYENNHLKLKGKCKEIEELGKIIAEKYRKQDYLKEIEKLLSEIQEMNSITEKFKEIEKENIEIEKSLKSTLKSQIQVTSDLKNSQFEYKGIIFTIRNNNLIHEDSEAIVNPDNSNLAHAGGAAKAIADAAGEEFEEDWNKYIKMNKELITGKAMLTRAGGNLMWDYVIHVVGPRYKNKADNSREEEQLKSTVRSIMEIVKDENIASVSIPAISIGIFKFPLELCVKLMAQTIKVFIDRYQLAWLTI